MKTLLTAFFGLMAAYAQTSLPGPYYATPAWSQKMQCDSISNCPRFQVLSNWNSEAVLDRETGLVWERKRGDTDFQWIDAVRHCTTSTVGGHVGWRLPTIQELASLADPNVTPPAPFLPPGHPFQGTDLRLGVMWASSVWQNDSNYAWSMSFFDALVSRDAKGNHFKAFCVTSGKGVLAQ